MSETHPLLKSLLSPRNLKLLAIAFGVGLLLFLFLWLDQRNDTDFFRASPGTTSGEDAALPAPLPADVAGDDRNTSGLTMPSQAQRTNTPPGESPRIIEPAAPTVPSPQANVPASRTDAAADTTPVPISRPPPVYPAEALRRGAGGSVRVQATIAIDGSVERMEIAQSSGNRYLDRAALDAVRRWRFKPAMRSSQPVSATVVIPLDFTPNP